MADEIAYIDGARRMRLINGSDASAVVMAPRRLPPYGREVLDALAARASVNVRLYACRPDPWTPARAHHAAFGAASTLVLPVDVDPLSLHWPPLRNVLANVTGLPGDAVRALARALVRDGLRLGYLLDSDQPARSLRVIRKERAR